MIAAAAFAGGVLAVRSHPDDSANRAEEVLRSAVETPEHAAFAGMLHLLCALGRIRTGREGGHHLRAARELVTPAAGDPTDSGSDSVRTTS